MLQWEWPSTLDANHFSNLFEFVEKTDILILTTPPPPPLSQVDSLALQNDQNGELAFLHNMAVSA